MIFRPDFPTTNPCNHAQFHPQRNPRHSQITDQVDILSEVILDTAAGEIVSVITTRSVEALDLKPGDAVTAQVKSTNISLCKCSCGHH